MNKILLALLLAITPTAFASVWYVDGTHGGDSNDCKTRQTACKTIGHAISLASSGDTIGIGPGTYTENLTISIGLKMIGASGAMTTIIDGGKNGTVVTVSTATAHVTLSKVTIQNGLASFGGGILINNGTLRINDSTLGGNVAAFGGGIFNKGTLKIDHSTLSRNLAERASNSSRGGGIYNDVTGTLTINDSTISGNTAIASPGSGGGIYNYGTLTINDSTISGNNVGGYFPSYGGGIGNDVRGTLTINNSTISGNSVRNIRSFGGGVANSGTVAISNSTVNGNSGGTWGGGVANSGTVAISNSTLSGNSAHTGGGIYGTATLQNSIVANSPSGGNCSGSITSDGYNVGSDNTCNFNGPGDLNNTNPVLGPLQYNGGPTQTQALLPGSPAIDAGNPQGCTDGQGHLLRTDQRGKPRHDKEDTGGCDMGAYERQKD
jgi:hypothetical protein